MRVFVVGRFYTEGFGKHIADSLEALGHEVVQFDPFPNQKSSLLGKSLGILQASLKHASLQIAFLRQQEAAKLQRAALAHGQVDLTIVCHDFLTPSQVRVLQKATRAPVVLWFPDHIGVLGRSLFLNARYDALFFKDPYIVATLDRELRIRSHYLPECYNDRSLGLTPLSDADRLRYQCDITTAGNIYPARIALFSQLERYHVRIWGNPPPRWMELGNTGRMLQGRFVADADKAKAFRGARIVLNNLNIAEIWGVNVRTFEICGAGGFQIVTWRRGIDALFVDGRELVTYRDVPELMDKLEYYLAHDDEREDIARAGYLRASAQHTYAHRLTTLFNVINGAGDGFPIPS
jgi:spore maturation protein CgeB